MGGNTGLRDNEMLYEMAASRDKDFIVVEGATHNLEPCTECEAGKDSSATRRRTSSTTLPGGCRRGTDLRARGYDATALSVMSSPRSMIANASRISASVMHSGGLVKK